MTLGNARLLKIAVGLATVVLTAFHGVLLWERIADGSLLELKIAFEWIAGLLLLLALLRLRTLGRPLHRGRAAIILWLLVSLLHAVAVVPGHGGALELELDQQLLFSLPLGILAAAAVSCFLGALRSLGGLLPPRPGSALLLALPVRDTSPGAWSVPGCRAPPACRLS